MFQVGQGREWGPNPRVKARVQDTQNRGQDAQGRGQNTIEAEARTLEVMARTLKVHANIPWRLSQRQCANR